MLDSAAEYSDVSDYWSIKLSSTPSRTLRRVTVIPWRSRSRWEWLWRRSFWTSWRRRQVKSTFTEAFIKIHKSHEKRVVNRVKKLQMEFTNLTIVRRWSSSWWGRGSRMKMIMKMTMTMTMMMILRRHSEKSCEHIFDNAGQWWTDHLLNLNLRPIDRLFFYHFNISSNFTHQTDDSYDHDRETSRYPARRSYKHLDNHLQVTATLPPADDVNLFIHTRETSLNTICAIRSRLTSGIKWGFSSNTDCFSDAVPRSMWKKCASTSAHSRFLSVIPPRNSDWSSLERQTTSQCLSVWTVESKIELSIREYPQQQSSTPWKSEFLIWLFSIDRDRRIGPVEWRHPVGPRIFVILKMDSYTLISSLTISK